MNVFFITHNSFWKRVVNICPWYFLIKSIAWTQIPFIGFLQFFSDSSAATAKSRQSCLILCSPIDGSPPGSSVPGILQARTLEWVAISLSNAWKWKVKGKSLSRVRLFATPWTAAYQAPPSMGFSRQEYWSGVPLPSPSNSSSGQKFSDCELLIYFRNFCIFLNLDLINSYISLSYKFIFSTKFPLLM